MKKFALLLSLVFVAGVAFAQEAKQAAPAPAPAKAAAVKTHDVKAEIVSVATDGKTVTIKGKEGDQTVPVLNAKAMAAVKDLKAGEKVTLICEDTAKGEHVGVTGVKEKEKK